MHGLLLQVSCALQSMQYTNELNKSGSINPCKAQDRSVVCCGKVLAYTPKQIPTYDLVMLSGGGFMNDAVKSTLRSQLLD